MTDETLRRVRAAIAYADREQREIAAGLAISTRTLERWKVTGPTRPTINLPLLAAECGLPPAFFAADFDRLAEIAPSSQDAERPAMSPPLPGTGPAPMRRRDPRAS